MNFIVLFVLFIVSAANFCRSEIQIDWDFDNGNLGSWERIDEHEIRLEHSKISEGLWYFFKIRGVDNQNLTFVFESARADYYGNLNFPAISYDGVQWQYETNVLIQPNTENPSTVRYSFTHAFDQDDAWIAYSTPFHNGLLDEWLVSLASHPHLEIETICRTTLLDQTLPLLKITNPQSVSPNKPGWLIVCREDSHETASSWMGMGAALFLLSDDPLAAQLRDETIWWIVPIFDRDGVALGHAQHPLPGVNPNVFWTETWQETIYSFHEQREMKAYLQAIRDQKQLISGAFRVHSNNWQNNVFRPEHLDDREVEFALGQDDIVQRYLPWFFSQEALNLDTRLSRFVVDLFPNAYTGFFQSDYVIDNAFGTEFRLYKSFHDLLIEGELLVRGVAEAMGFQSQSVPPYLLSAHIEDHVKSDSYQYSAQCVYFDSLNRAPVSVQVLANGEEIELSPLSSELQDYSKGVIYKGFFSLEQPLTTHSFTATNGITSCTVPKYELPEINENPSE